MGTFGRPCFAFVKTQIVGKTKFFDSLKHAFGVFFFFCAQLANIPGTRYNERK